MLNKYKYEAVALFFEGKFQYNFNCIQSNVALKTPKQKQKKKQIGIVLFLKTRLEFYFNELKWNQLHIKFVYKLNTH